jgi:hypothetical protein
MLNIHGCDKSGMFFVSVFKALGDEGAVTGVISTIAHL